MHGFLEALGFQVCGALSALPGGRGVPGAPRAAHIAEPSALFTVPELAPCALAASAVPH